MMTQLLVALTLILGSHTELAHIYPIVNKESCDSIQCSNLVNDKVLSPKEFDASYNELLNTSLMSALLDAVDISGHVATENQEFYKVHLANRSLKKLVIERLENNRLLNSKFQKIGAMDG